MVCRGNWGQVRMHAVTSAVFDYARLGDERNNKSPTYWNQMEIDNRIRRSGLCG